jgi:diguanylate cyclase (GGDEF)-like protein
VRKSLLTRGSAIPGNAQPTRLPFAVVAVFAFASVLYPSGPARAGCFLAALGLVLLSSLTLYLSGWARAPRALDVAPPLLAVASIGCLAYSAGTSTGLLSLLLLPLIFSALYGKPWESFVIIPAICVTLGVVGHADGGTGLVVGRLLVVWVTALSMISLVAHRLRLRLESTVSIAREEARQSAVMSEAMRALTATLNSAQVIRTATRLTNALASPATKSGGRSQYFAVAGGTLSIVTDSDATGAPDVELTLQVADNPLISRVFETGQPAFEPVESSPQESGFIGASFATQVTDSAAVPIHIEGRIQGILAVSGRGQPLPPGAFDRVVTLGQLTELALASASAHESLETQARTDPLTGLVNRRGLDEALERLTDRRPFAFLAIDLDDLKTTNDSYGHAAGDAAIAAVATALKAVVRRGDTIARVGGDEFAVLMLDATMDGAERLTARIQTAISGITLNSGSPSLSIGCCVAPPGMAPTLVQGAADAALYEAKHQGGGCTNIRRLAVVEPAQPEAVASLR